MKKQKRIKCILFIEGTSNTNNGSLKMGFNKLLSQKLGRKMPRIIMAEGKSIAVKKFKKSTLSDEKYLLVDLDAPPPEKAKDLEKNKLLTEEEIVFYMIQEMETWFISQPKILDKFYKTNISTKLPQKQPQSIKEPDKLLMRLTKNTAKGTYHKVNHGTQLLELLDAEKLAVAFPEFADLIAKLID